MESSAIANHVTSYIPVIYCLNKIDAISIEELDLLYRIPNAVPISSEHGWNLDELLEAMWEKLQLKRVYTKPKGKLPDYSAPVVLKSNKSTVEDFVSSSTYPIPQHFHTDTHSLSSLAYLVFFWVVFFSLVFFALYSLGLFIHH